MKLARKRDGTEYPPETPYHIVCGIMHFIRQNGRPEVDVFKNQDYIELRATLDAEMKRLKRAGKGSHKRQVEPSTPEEELLWEKGILGSDTPKAPATEQFFHPDWFALRSGDQHRR